LVIREGYFNNSIFWVCTSPLLTNRVEIDASGHHPLRSTIHDPRSTIYVPLCIAVISGAHAS
jgi:hypothetical protein